MLGPRREAQARGRRAGGGRNAFPRQAGELSPASQARLLRLVQNKEYARLGDTEMRKADVRVVAVSVRSLPEMVKAGMFRADLYTKLSAVQIALPPLRDRLGDLEVLVRHFLSRFGPAHGHQNASVTAGALELLAARRWLENVKSVEDFIEQRVLVDPPGDIVIDEAPSLRWWPAPSAPPARPTRDVRMEEERKAVEEAMKKAGGNRAKAARLLGISRRTLFNKLDVLGLTDP